jgi:hypothetical protein
MNKFTLVFLTALSVVSSEAAAQKTVTVDPKDIQLSPYRHKELPPSLLKRIRITTDAFEKIDGITYDQAVDLYKRDLDPESNLVLWEEMVRAYKEFCKSRCTAKAEQSDVYRSLLLRTMFSEDESVKRSRLSVLTVEEARRAMRLYRLPPKPIDVVQAK